MTDLFASVEILKICWQYFILGIIQGITEFLPISSTAHLKVLPMMLGWDDPGVSVSATIQLGSIAAIIIYFRNDLKKIIKGIVVAIIQKKYTEPNAQLGIALIIGSMPILLAGIYIKLFWNDFDISPIRSIPSISIVSILMAFLLAYAEKIGSRKKKLSSMKSIAGIWIGLGQMLAIIPGVSRSGISLTTALIYGFKREDAARFSFLLGIPAISIAGIIEFNNALSSEFTTGGLPLIIGIITSASVSWLTIDWLIIYLKRSSTKVFIIYRLLFGLLALIWWLDIRL